MHRVFLLARASRPAVLWFLSLVLVSAACSFDGSGPSPGPREGEPDAGAGGEADGPPAPDATPLPDADPRDGCGGLCPPPGICEEATGTCVFVCGDSSGEGVSSSAVDEESSGSGAACPDVVVCPAHIPCRVRCEGEDSCARGVDCSAAASCRIECTGERSCGSGGPIVCGAGECDIRCTDEETCLGGMDCASSCFCSIDCSGESSCPSEAVCPAGCDDSPGCRTNGQCDDDC